MASSATGMRALFAEQMRLQGQLADVNQRILATIMRDEVEAKPGRSAASKTAARTAKGSKSKTGSRKTWFARGEASKLMQRLLKKPMRPSELVHAALAAKGYTKTNLSPADFKRVGMACYQAIYQATRAKKLARNAKGLLVKVS